ncbi:MAG TPA: rod shape-determining protein RodA [Clostridiales bacterium]|nr:rod shape-determining protein RodA [Clostridiales bacterium]
MLSKLKRYDFKRYNITLLIIVIILGLIGAFLIKQVQAEGENLFLKHLVGIAGGIMIVLVLSLIDYHFICNFYIILYIIGIVLLVMVKLFGRTINHAQRWVMIGPIQFQPSELSKIILILFLATVFSIFRSKINNFLLIGLSFISVAIPIYFIQDQPNLSTCMIILFIFCMMIFAAGLSWKIILPVLIIGIPAFLGLFWYIQQDYQVLLNDYQQGRVLSILNPEEYPETMYQQDNSELSIGSGQLYGKIFDGTDKRNYDSIPISESDFIFSVAGEEFGFIGCCFILALYGIIIYICLATARKAPDYMGMLISVGIASMFMFQVFVNIGVATKFLPNTGVPLPFLSSGLSSLISGMLAVGLILNIRLQPKRGRS